MAQALSAPTKLLLTGASGFVGSALDVRLRRDGWQVRRSGRGEPLPFADGGEFVRVGPLDATTDWTVAVAGVDVVVHAAARVHILRDTAIDPLGEMRRANVDGTLALARQAASAGVRRFVYFSSIKVNGEGTKPGRPYRVTDEPRPVDLYGISKREAEDALRQLSAATGMEVTVVRPVLVYGPGVKGNFRAMMGALTRSLPLPLGAIENRRSLVGIQNLVDLGSLLVCHPAAANQTFLVSDQTDLSTPELLRRTAKALGVRARLIPVPPSLIRAVGNAIGKGTTVRRLLDSLQVEISRTELLLGWSPPVTVDEELERTARHYLGGETS